jgi:hypothetical protein
MGAHSSTSWFIINLFIYFLLFFCHISRNSTTKCNVSLKIRCLGPTLPEIMCLALCKLLEVGRAIDQAVSRRLPTAAARVQTRVWSCGIL